MASWLLPTRLRAPIEAVYAFARGADDIADEGERPDAERLAGLARYERALDEIERGEPQSQPPFREIAAAIRNHALPVAALRDLLDAFRQDVTRKRYGDFDMLLDYCRRSANPVGRLVLHLFGMSDAASVRQSDSICSALQLVNFWQDVERDWIKGRVYIPAVDLERFDVGESHIAERRADERWKALMAFECERARGMLRSGAPLGRRLPGRMGLEIRATVAGASRILDRIDAAGGDVFRHRPVLRAVDWIVVLAKSI